MKYQVEMVIDLPKEKVTELISDPNNMSKWQEGFVEMSHVSGNPGEVGAVSKMRYKMGKREIEMTETIEAIDLPHSFVMIYQSDMAWNRHDDTFTDLEGGTKTLWKADNEFRFNGFFKLMAWMMKSMFKKQSLKFMTDFKNFAEKGIDVNAKNA